MRRSVVIGLCLVATIIGHQIISSRSGKTPGDTMEQAIRTITPEQILHLSQDNDQPLRLRSTADVIPGGLSAAMVPMIIDWKNSRIDDRDPFVVVHNINYGGNPIEGTTVLHTVKIPLNGVKDLEWTLVPLGPGGRKAAIHHGQLRFTFHQDQPVEILSLTNEAGGGDHKLYDLVFSWEAWRAPGVDFDVRTGLDPSAYALSLRVYAGPQRFLEDALARRDWFSTPLKMPGGDRGLSAVLKVNLALGDGIARHTLSDLFNESQAAWLANAPTRDHETLIEQWQRLKALADPHKITDDPRLNLPKEERSYQTLLRSCASVAYYSVIVAVNRLAEVGLTDGVNMSQLDAAHLGGEQPWMLTISETNMGGLLMRAPLALNWLRKNPYALPDKIPGRLDKAGLVVREDGKPVEIHHALNKITPYGTLADNLIR